jgi:hypothetical protein
LKLNSKDTRQAYINNVLTSNPHNRQKTLGCEHLLQDSSHKGELYDTAQGSEHERSANVELKRLRDYRIKRDKGEAKADVGPAEVRDCVIRRRIHVCPDFDLFCLSGGGVETTEGDKRAAA